MLLCPEIAYHFTAYLPLYQGEQPVVAMIRVAGDDVRVIHIGETRGRSFKENVLPYLIENAEKLIQVDRTPELYAMLNFCGSSLGGAEISFLLDGQWSDDAWTYTKLAGTAAEAILDDNDERLPLNQFRVPRMALINAINFAYSAPERVYLSMCDDDLLKLDEQLGLFAERTLTLPRNDPDALLEHKGEGRVIALGVALWHHFHARSVRAGWARDIRELAS